MKKIIFLVLFFAISSVSAAEITGGRFNGKTFSIEVDVVYGGGCKKHEFSLKKSACLETYPVQCSATLMEKTNGDLCEALIHETLSFNLEDEGYDVDYYDNAKLTILGDNDSKVVIQLPGGSF